MFGKFELEFEPYGPKGVKDEVKQARRAAT